MYFVEEYVDRTLHTEISINVHEVRLTYVHGQPSECGFCQYRVGLYQSEFSSNDVHRQLEVKHC
jgi:hypothetical protein